MDDLTPGGRSAFVRWTFPVGLVRRVQGIERDLYDADHGLIAEVQRIRERTDATYWVALGTLGTMVAGVATIVISALHVHL